MKKRLPLIFGAQFVRHHAERKKIFIIFTKYCPFLIYNYSSLMTKNGW